MQNENIVKELRQYMKVKADEAIMSKFKSYQKYLQWTQTSLFRMNTNQELMNLANKKGMK